MKRQRQKHTPHVDVNGTTSFWNGSNWITTAITPHMNIPPHNYEASLLIDIKSEGKWVYNDVSHEKLEASYGVPNITTQVRDPFLTWLQESTNPLAPKHMVPCSKIITDLQSRYGPRISQQYPISRVEKWFESMFLPTAITVNADPFGSEFSVWFLLADIVEIPKLAAQLLKSSLVRRGPGGNLTFKQLANDKLMTDFGIRATYRDFVDFFDAIKRFKKGIEDFQNAQQKVYRWHGVRENVLPNVPIPRNYMSGEYSPKEGLHWHGFGYGPLCVTVYTDVTFAQHTRTMAYRLKCPELSGWFARFSQLVDSFGIIDPSAIWDLIPFSFLVDWLVPVGNWLHNNRPRLFPASVEVVDYCESLEIEYNSIYTAAPASDTDSPLMLFPDDTGYAAMANIGREYRKTYLRRRFTPTVGNVRPTNMGGLLSLRHAEIATALTAQRLPRSGRIGWEHEAVNFGPDVFPALSVQARAQHQELIQMSKDIYNARVKENILQWRFEQSLSEILASQPVTITPEMRIKGAARRAAQVLVVPKREPGLVPDKPLSWYRARGILPIYDLRNRIRPQ